MSTFRERLHHLQSLKKSTLCAGIDPDLEKIPACLKDSDNPIFTFCKDIIEKTAPYVIAYKFNFAFFEIYGAQGWETLAALKRLVPDDCLTIADAKRGDIGNSARNYAAAIFDNLGFDAVTVNPYMGADASAPFLAYKDKGVFFLCLTSNPGAADIQLLGADSPLYMHVARLIKEWDTARNCGMVVGATKLAQLEELSQLCPDIPFLIPGVGAQGATTEDVLKSLAGKSALIAASRSILYAGNDSDFASAAADAASEMQSIMAQNHP